MEVVLVSRSLERERALIRGDVITRLRRSNACPQMLDFLVTKKEEVFCLPVESARHAAIAAFFDLRPSEFHEAVWNGEREEDLHVRVLEGENENWWRAIILAKYPTKRHLFEESKRHHLLDLPADLLD